MKIDEAIGHAIGRIFEGVIVLGVWVYLAVMVAIPVGIGLAVLYALVRFIKWAWQG